MAELKKLQSEVGHFEVYDIPLHITGNIIGEGSAAVIFQHKLRKKVAACKKFKQQLSRKSILRAASKFVKLNHENIVRFRGFCTRPSAILLEYCVVEINGKSS